MLVEGKGGREGGAWGIARLPALFYGMSERREREKREREGRKIRETEKKGKRGKREIDTEIDR